MRTPVNEPSLPVGNEFVPYYNELYQEEGRLSRGVPSILEFARSQEIIGRHLPPTPQVLLDVGGGPGAYSCWLARQGHEVHLIDIVPKHIEQARQASRNQPAYPIASINLGDARSLPQDDSACDAVLLMGPMYHLTERSDRITALREAYRVLKPGGLLFASTINRFVSLLDGLTRGFIDDPYFLEILNRDLSEGQHRNPRQAPDYFTTAYFHRPEDLQAEISEAGFTLIETVAVQGAGWLTRDFAERWADPERRAQILDLLRRVEREPAMMGISHHIMAVARKQKVNT
jgi:ubiquinone/menaquinone biosynthesis C-methylase UbiE